MDSYIEQNKAAWEFDAYHFWVEHAGTPSQRAIETVKDPKAMLHRYSAYYDTYRGLKIANICGSCGKKAVPLALLGAEVTVFDISEGNKRYALELAEAAHTSVDFVVGDVMETDLTKYGGCFDVVFMEGGILHYFHDIGQFMGLMHALLKDGGRMICSDFHPFRKIVDVLKFEQPPCGYFSTEIIEGEMAHARFYPDEIRSQVPLCQYRLYNLSEIINASLENGFTLQRFDEHPAWTNRELPGEFTLVAKKL